MAHKHLLEFPFYNDTELVTDIQGHSEFYPQFDALLRQRVEARFAPAGEA